MNFESFVALFIILFHLSVVVSQSPLDFSIQSPSENAVYLIKPTESSIELTIDYSFQDLNAVSGICFQINSDEDNSELLKETCFPPGMQSVTITNVLPNKYRLSAVTTGVTEGQIGPLVQRSFRVQSLIDVQPKLKILNERFVFVCDEGVQQSMVAITYNVTQNVIPISNFLVCAQLYELPSEMLLTNVSCFETTESVISMTLPINYYRLSLFYQDKFTNTYFENDKTYVTFEVASFQKYLPNFRVVQKSLELIVDKQTSKADATIAYVLDGDKTTFNKFDICIEVIDLSNNTLFMSLSCVDYTEPRVITLGGVPEGLYKGNLVLRNKQNPELIYAKSLNVIQLEARLTSEFIPTYEWQPLKRWHTIPLGLETRLPLSEGGGNKEARIPPTWRAQLNLPDICHASSGSYFLRVQLERTTPLLRIRYVDNIIFLSHYIVLITLQFIIYVCIFLI